MKQILKKEKKKRIVLNCFLAIGVFFVFNTLVSLLNLDMLIQSVFFDINEGWYLGEMPIFKALYLFGEKPAWVLFFVSLLCFSLSFFNRSSAGNDHSGGKMSPLLRYARKKRKGFLLIILLMIIGPGLVVNTALKDHMGRPRPREIVDFGGEHEFVGPWEKGEAGRNSSFPSGHASAAFYLFAPFFILGDKEKNLKRFFLWLGILFGSLMGLARIAQGAHFFSDVVWAGIIVFFTAIFLRDLLPMENAEN